MNFNSKEQNLRNSIMNQKLKYSNFILIKKLYIKFRLK